MAFSARLVTIVYQICLPYSSSIDRISYVCKSSSDLVPPPLQVSSPLALQPLLDTANAHFRGRKPLLLPWLCAIMATLHNQPYTNDNHLAWASLAIIAAFPLTHLLAPALPREGARIVYKQPDCGDQRPPRSSCNSYPPATAGPLVGYARRP